MKTVKPAVLFAVGILAVLLAAGCSNPIASPPEKIPATGMATEPDGSFTVSFTLGGDGNARSVAGLDTNRIKISGQDGIRNFVQLIVVDETSKQIVGFDEYRKSSAANTTYTLTVPSLLRNETYAFLLLMGHWEYTGNYSYNATKPPTLLAAGLTKDLMLNPTGDTTVTISMYPLAVDTLFTTGSTYIEPRMTGGRPETVYLSPEVWDVYWAVQRSAAGTNGFEKALVPAQMVTYPTFDNLLVKDNRFILNSAEAVSLGAGETPNMIIYTIPPEETKNGKSGSVNFNLEYMPFNLGDKSSWSGFHSDYFNLTQGAPVWIIRNGVNDLAQDGNTNFSDFGTIAGAHANANGAIRYEVLPPPPDGTPNTLIVDDGKFAGSTNPLEARITFDTSGYTGMVDAWYAISESGAAPGRDMYVWLNKVPAGNDHERTVAVPPGVTDYYVYVVISQDGEVSAPEIIHVQSPGNIHEDDAFAIEDLDLSGSIMIPVTGSTRSTAFTKSSPEYTASVVTWSPAAGSVFAANTEYTATVTLTATSTATLNCNFDADTWFTFNGASSVSIPILSSNRKTATVSITFPVTGSPSALFDLSPFINAPTDGQTPFPASSSGGSIFQGPAPGSLWFYCSSVSWSKSGNGSAWAALTANEQVNLNNYYYKVRIKLEKTGAYPFGDFASLTADAFYCTGAFDIDVIMPNPSWVEIEIFFPKPIP